MPVHHRIVEQAEGACRSHVDDSRDRQVVVALERLHRVVRVHGEIASGSTADEDLQVHQRSLSSGYGKAPGVDSQVRPRRFRRRWGEDPQGIAVAGSTTPVTGRPWNLWNVRTA